jgi:hypothetical protein
MTRLAAFALAVLTGLLLVGCGATLGQTGFSAPHAADDVQTVSDAADSLDVHRHSATENAKAAIVVTDALGSVIRSISDNERFLAGSSDSVRPRAAARLVLSRSQLVMQPSVGNVSAYCQSSAGYSIRGIPSLDETFGWQSGAYSGGTRTLGGRGLSTWSANATGQAVAAPIGGLSVDRTGDAGCPMMTPTFSVHGATASNAFSIPIMLTYRRGLLWNFTVSNAAFSDGESLNVTTSSVQQPVISGVITRGRTELATFRTNALGDGRLTITSTGAQYVIADWIVTGI